MMVSIDSRHLVALQHAAREYADKRHTAVVDDVNQATAAMIEAGVFPVKRWGVDTVWATDGGFGPPKALIEKYGIDGKKVRG